MKPFWEQSEQHLFQTQAFMVSEGVEVRLLDVLFQAAYISQVGKQQVQRRTTLGEISVAKLVREMMVDQCEYVLINVELKSTSLEYVVDLRIR